jgi:hypothetical protein
MDKVLRDTLKYQRSDSLFLEKNYFTHHTYQIIWINLFLIIVIHPLAADS